MHEASGPGRRAFAAAIAGGLEGPVLWVLDARRREAFCPQGLLPLLDPARLVIARPTGMLTVLQVMEEALRSGAVPLVIGDLDEAPDLTLSRRLQLAAGTGGGRALCLVPEGRLRANASETRWHCAPIPAGTPGVALQHWEIVKNRRGRLGAWEVALGAATRPAPMPLHAAAP
jgi:protein ImuA